VKLVIVRLSILP